MKGMLLVLTVHSDPVLDDHALGEDASSSSDTMRSYL